MFKIKTNHKIKNFKTDVACDWGGTMNFQFDHLVTIKYINKNL